MRSRARFDDSPAPTTAQHLAEVWGSWTRIEILIALAGPRCDASELAEALGFRPNLLSNHLRTLRTAKLVHAAVEGKRHVYTLTEAATVRLDGARARIRLRADDGCRFDLHLTLDSRSARVLEKGVRWARRPRIATFTIVEPKGEVKRAVPRSDASSRSSEPR